MSFRQWIGHLFGTWEGDPMSTYQHAFGELKTVQPFGFMSLRVPRLWQECEQEEGALSYLDPADPAVTELCLAYQVMFWEPAREVTPERAVQRYWRATKLDGSERLQWMVRDRSQDCTLILLIDLFLERDLAGRWKYKRLIFSLDREIRRMRIGTPPPDAPSMLAPGGSHEGGEGSQA